MASYHKTKFRGRKGGPRRVANDKLQISSSCERYITLFKAVFVVTAENDSFKVAPLATARAFSSPLILGSASIAGGVAGFPLRTHRERFIVRPIVTPALMARNEFRTDNLELKSARGTSKG